MLLVYLSCFLCFLPILDFHGSQSFIWWPSLHCIGYLNVCSQPNESFFWLWWLLRRGKGEIFNEFLFEGMWVAWLFGTGAYCSSGGSLLFSYSGCPSVTILRLSKCHTSYVHRAVLEALATQCSTMVLLWLTAQYILVLILLTKKTHLFWRCHFLVLGIWFLKYIAFCYFRDPNLLCILYKFLSVLICRYTLPRFSALL